MITQLEILYEKYELISIKYGLYGIIKCNKYKILLFYCIYNIINALCKY